MNSLNIDNQIDAIKEVSSNALTKHGFSRSRQRLFDLSKELDQSWQNYKAIVDKNALPEFVVFTLSQSTNGLKLKSISRRSSIPVSELTLILSRLIITSKISWNKETKLYKKK